MFNREGQRKFEQIERELADMRKRIEAIDLKLATIVKILLTPRPVKGEIVLGTPVAK